MLESIQKLYNYTTRGTDFLLVIEAKNAKIFYMDHALETELKTQTLALDEVIERIKTVTEIMEAVTELSNKESEKKTREDIEEYYIAQVNRWILFAEEKKKELEKKEGSLAEIQRKYLGTLKKVKELEDQLLNLSEKYEYLKTKK